MKHPRTVILFVIETSESRNAKELIPSKLAGFSTSHFIEPQLFLGSEAALCADQICPSVRLSVNPCRVLPPGVTETGVQTYYAGVQWVPDSIMWVPDGCLIPLWRF